MQMLKIKPNCSHLLIFKCITKPLIYIWVKKEVLFHFRSDTHSSYGKKLAQDLKGKKEIIVPLVRLTKCS